MSRLPPIPDPLDCVLFDAGDTLLAPAPSFQGRFVAVAADQGLPLEEAAVDAAVADAVRAAAWPDDWTDPATHQLFDDVRPALDELAGRGITLGVVSNFEPWLADILALQEVDHLFATVVISGVLGVAKPDPRIFEAALAGAGADPSATVHVGDQPANDVAAARSVGITPVLIDRFARYPAPDDAHRVEDLAGLVQLVKVNGVGNGQRSGCWT